MAEIVNEPQNLEDEIEDFLSNAESPEGISPRIRLGDKRTVDGKVTVYLSIFQDPDGPRNRSISVHFPKDDLGRHISLAYDFSKKKYQKVENPDYRAGGAARFLETRDMDEQAETEAREWLDKFKMATKEGHDETG